MKRDQPVKIMVSLKEASELTGLPYSCIRELCLSGFLRFIRSGKKYYVNTESLLDYCNGVEDNSNGPYKMKIDCLGHSVNKGGVTSES